MNLNISRKLLICLMPVLSLLSACNKEDEEPLDQEKPQVSFVSLEENATLRGEVSISINASDNKGISKVDFFVNDVFKKEFNLEPYQLILNTRDFADGNHVLKAVAHDANGNSQEAVLNVFVSNNLLTVQVAENAVFNNDERGKEIWVFVSDLNGNNLAVMEVKNGENKVLQTLQDFSGNEIYVHILNVNSYNYSAYKSVHIRSYVTKISDNLSIKDYTNQSSEYVGQAEISITNQPLTATSSPKISFENYDGYTFMTDSDRGNFALTLYKSPVIGLYTYRDKENSLYKYQWLDNVEVNGSYTFDFNTISSMTKKVEFNIPSSTYIRYSLLGATSAENPQFIDVGSVTTEGGNLSMYLPDNTFQTYTNSLSFNDNEGGFYFYSVGPILTDVTKASGRFTVLNNTIDNFSVSTTGDFEVANLSLGYYDSREGSTNSVYWSFTAPKDENISFNIPTIPSEISGAYPFIVNENLTTQDLYLTDYVDISSYDEYIDYMYNPENTLVSKGQKSFYKSFGDQNARLAKPKTEVEALEKMRNSRF